MDGTKNGRRLVFVNRLYNTALSHTRGDATVPTIPITYGRCCTNSKEKKNIVQYSVESPPKMKLGHKDT